MPLLQWLRANIEVVIAIIVLLTPLIIIATPWILHAIDPYGHPLVRIVNITWVWGGQVTGYAPSGSNVTLVVVAETDPCDATAKIRIRIHCDIPWAPDEVLLERVFTVRNITKIMFNISSIPPCRTLYPTIEVEKGIPLSLPKASRKRLVVQP